MKGCSYFISMPIEDLLFQQDEIMKQPPDVSKRCGKCLTLVLSGEESCL
jgi:hypothetical protein